MSDGGRASFAERNRRLIITMAFKRTDGTAIDRNLPALSQLDSVELSN